LSAIAGHDISEGNDEEDAEVDVQDAAEIAKGLAGMDDLESDLFGSFTSKKVNQKAKGSSSLFDSKKKKKKPESTDFDEDDPLAGLGLSDDDDIPSKPKPKKPELTRRLSGTSKGKVDPNIAISDAQSQNSTPVRSPSFDRDDPFLATDPRPRSGSGTDRKFKRINSWDEPSIGTQSESELTPRSRSGSSEQQMKNGRRGSKKKKVNPSPPKAEIETKKDREDSHDVPDSSRMDHNQSATVERPKGKDKIKPAKQIDDIFGDEEGLPGLSEDESSSPRKKPLKSIVDDAEPTRSAAAALDDLLGGKSKVKESKSRKPTFLEQMMSKGTTKKNASDLDTESPITSPREKSVAFGGYSPSVGGAMERPISAPSKRSVRFADELGFDELDLSLNDSRPSTAPGSGRSRMPNRLKDASIGSSFEDENTDMSLDLSTSDFKRSSTPTSTAVDTKDRYQSQSKTKDSTDKSSISTKPSSPRRSLQNSRRKHQVMGEEQQADQDNWLGLGDPQASHADKNVSKSSEPISSRTESEDKKVVGSRAGQVSQDDWLGLSDENIHKTLQSEAQGSNDQMSNQIKETSEKKKQNEKSSAPNDDLFPWETPGLRERPRRRNRILEDTTRESELKKNEASAVLKRESFVNSSSKENRSEAMAKHANQIDAGKASIFEKQLQAKRKPISNDNSNVIPSSMSLGSSMDVAETTSQQSQRQNSFQSATISQQPQMVEQPAFVSQQFPPYTGSSSSTASSGSQLLYNQDTVMNQTFAAQHPMILNQMGVNDQSILLSTKPSLLAVSLEKANAEKVVQQHRINEYEIEKVQNENALKSLETELRSMYSKVSEMGEGKTRVQLESSKRIEDLQEKVMKLELENDHLKSSQEVLKDRHNNEIKAVESSHKMRFQILEDTYKRRELQLKEDNDFTVQQLNERIKAVEMEKNEIVTTHKERLMMIEKSKETDLERLKSLHKKAIDDLRKDFEDQLERLRMLKEQELAAATSMFSHTRSLQALIQQVQNSTTEVEQMQKRIDLSHKDNLNEREQSLRVRDEYLKSMQEKLQRQEVESMEERSRLQSLIAKLEMQLREQGRQLEQDRWKVLQDENRIKSMQDAIEEERRYTLQQLNNERQMIDKSRDDLMNEQRRILADCNEERRRVTAEKAELEKIQGKYNKDNLDKEFAALNEREVKISQKEERLEKELQELEHSFKKINEEKQKLQEFAKVVHAKSKEIESLSKEAMRVQQEGIESLEHAHAMNVELANTSAAVENKAMLLDQQERELSEKLASFEMAKAKFEASKSRVRCNQCNQCTIETPLALVTQVIPEDSHQAQRHDRKYLSEQQQQNQKLGSVSSPPVSPDSLSIASTTSLDDKQLVKENESHLQPPDVILGSLKFNRTVRKWSADKEEDEEFFEQEGRYLNEIQRKRAVKLASVS